MKEFKIVFNDDSFVVVKSIASHNNTYDTIHREKYITFFEPAFQCKAEDVKYILDVTQ